MDLIETYPELFNGSRVKVQFTKDEIELLRIAMVGEEKPFYSRSPERSMRIIVES